MDKVYKISGYDPISDDLITSFIIPDNLMTRVLEIIGPDYDGLSDYNISELTLESISYPLMKYGFKPDFELNYSIGPVN